LQKEIIDLVQEYKNVSIIRAKEAINSELITKRVELKGAKITLEQLKILSKIALKYSKGVEFTAKQNIQFREVLSKDVMEIDNILKSINLFSESSSNNSIFQVSNTCPVCKIDNNEILDIEDIVKKINIYFEKNKEKYSNFSKRVKISLNSCGIFCTTYEIHDVAFTAFKNSKEEIWFDLTIAGGLSRLKQTAIRVKKHIKKEQIFDVAIACADIFNEYIFTSNKSKPRMIHLLNDWKIEKFVDKLESRLSFKLLDAKDEPAILPFEQRNHFGIHQQKQKGLFYIGFATDIGRISVESFVKIYEICEKYSTGGISLTTTLNFIVYDIKEEFISSLAKDFNDIGFSYAPKAFRARLQACSGKELCKFGIAETKEFAKNMAKELENRLIDFDENISITFAGCNKGCSQPYIADIGLVGCLMRYKDKRVAGYEVFLGGNLQGEKSLLAKKIGVKVPADKLVDYILDLINEYKKDSKQASSFREYLKLIL